MNLGGWSSIHNDPIICATETTEDRVVYLTDNEGYDHNKQNFTKSTH